MSTDEFTKLFKYVQTEFGKVNSKLEQIATKEELNRLANTVDTYAKQSETFMVELLALGHKVNRIERNISK